MSGLLSENGGLAFTQQSEEPPIEGPQASLPACSPATWTQGSPVPWDRTVQRLFFEFCFILGFFVHSGDYKHLSKARPGAELSVPPLGEAARGGVHGAGLHLRPSRVVSLPQHFRAERWSKLTVLVCGYSGSVTPLILNGMD